MPWNRNHRKTQRVLGWAQPSRAERVSRRLMPGPPSILRTSGPGGANGTSLACDATRVSGDEVDRHVPVPVRGTRGPGIVIPRVPRVGM